MLKTRKTRYILGGIVALLITLTPLIAFADEGKEYVPDMYAKFWALLPPLVAIALALITKEVFSALFIGIVVGGLFWANFSPEQTLLHVVNDGFIAALSDGWNTGILIFLAILGMIVAMMNKGGGSAAFGKWASKHIKTRLGAQLATFVFSLLIFIDDYFACLTVGSVMRPVTDRQNISRAKLAYLIDATAAPICIIAPISSWAAAVSGFVGEGKGLHYFISAIPYNYYALLTLLMVFLIIIFKFDFGPMAKHEHNAYAGDLFTTEDRPYGNAEEVADTESRATLLDLIFPIVILIISCVLGMTYTGGLFDGKNIVDAFANSDASVGLVIGSLVAFIIIVLFYICRRVLSLKKAMDCVPEGLQAMSPAILILTFAWTLKNMTDSLGASEFVETLMSNSADGLAKFLPAIIFLVACGLAFATGTSWGTFGILIPIVVSVFEATDSTLLIIGMSACMAGAVCGDHCSPISDTTIMASAGAQSNHINHVNTQLPYAALIAAISFVMYILAAFIKNAPIVLLIGVIVTVGVLLFIKKAKIGGVFIEKAPDAQA